MLTKRLQTALEAITSLGNPVRRRIYDALAAEGHEVSRNEIAKSTGIARPLVAYHLDQLVKDGLLATRFERQTGKTGPGAGRPAKLYSRRRSPVQVTLPPRDFELAARVLLEALAQRPFGETQKTLDDLAEEIGERTATEHLETGNDMDSDVLSGLLEERGYEPQRNENGETCLKNCVFHELVDQQRELVCNMNYALLRGMLKALPDTSLVARLEPAPGRCCVVLAPTDGSSQA
jgi:predicted ArsR family transcriptional regulator